MTRDELRRLARLGAERRLEELQREEAAIRLAFPDLGSRAPGRARRRGRPPAAAVAADAAPRRRRKRRMSPSQRRAVSERMKKYWAERRKAR